MDLEAILLDALCSGELSAEQRAALLRLADRFPFRTVHGRVIAETLAVLPPLSPPDLKRELAAALTRNGFPDVPVDRHFDIQKAHLDYEELLAAVEQAVASGNTD